MWQHPSTKQCGSFGKKQCGSIRVQSNAAASGKKLNVAASEYKAMRQLREKTMWQHPSTKQCGSFGEKTECGSIRVQSNAAASGKNNVAASEYKAMRQLRGKN